MNRTLSLFLSLNDDPCPLTEPDDFLSGEHCPACHGPLPLRFKDDGLGRKTIGEIPETNVKCLGIRINHS